MLHQHSYPLISTAARRDRNREHIGGGGAATAEGRVRMWFDRCAEGGTEEGVGGGWSARWGDGGGTGGGSEVLRQQ